MTTFDLIQSELRVALNIMGVLISALIFALFGGATWMIAFDNDPPFHSVKARMLDSLGHERYIYHAGEVVQIRRDFCSDRTIAVQVGRLIRNIDTGTGVYIDSSNSMYRKGCAEGGNIIVLPEYTPPGKYRYEVSVRFSNNPFQDAVAELPEVFFEVVK